MSGPELGQKRTNDSDQSSPYKSRRYDLMKDLTYTLSTSQESMESIINMSKPQLESKIADKKKLCDDLVKNLENTLKDIQTYAMSRAQSELDQFCHLFDNEKASLQQLEASLEEQK